MSQAQAAVQTPAVQQEDQQQVKVVKVPFEDTELIYEAANSAVVWRAKTLYGKEPDTVAWIKQFNADDVFVDIGANVGMYTVLAARGRGARVYAFEPESQNFALLVRNVLYNQLQDRCTVFPMAVADRFKVDHLYLSQFGLGGSCHTFGENVDFHLKARNHTLSQGCVAMPLDDLVADGTVPEPNHVKIDVDGLEHLVLTGMTETLNHPALKSVLVELNTHLPEHRTLVEQMEHLGFVYAQNQVDIAIRQQGDFQGIGNYIFYRPECGINFDDLTVPEVRLTNHDFSGVKKHVADKLANLDLKTDPYPHFYIEELFPADYYAQMMAMKPTSEELVCINETGRATGYDERFVMHLTDGIGQLLSEEKRRFWQNHQAWFCAEDLMIVLIKQLHAELVKRGVTHLNLKPEAMFMRDKQGYGIGPHTDSPRRMLSMMVYLPEDTGHAHLGTSVFRPLEPGRVCAGDAHHGFEGFEVVKTAPYVPNSAFGFMKTDNSFHGVAPMQDSYERDTLAYIVKHLPGA